MNQQQKYPAGVGGRPGSPTARLTLLEKLTVAHVAILVIAAAWLFGGNSDGARFALSCWGSLAVLLFGFALRRPTGEAPAHRRALLWLAPLALFNGLVLTSLFNPSFRELIDGTRHFYVEGQAGLPLPSAARPDLAWRSLWFFDAVYLTCFNLVLVVRHRRALRILLVLLAANALALAIFGTVQKLAGASGLFFGAVKSPQVYFFASFIYHNHWGAFTVLMTAVALGLVFHFARRSEARDFWHSPAPVAIVAIALIAVTVPLSASRSCTIIIALLLVGALAHAASLILRRREGGVARQLWPIGAALVALAAIATFGYHLGRETIDQRLANTRDQVAQIRARGDLGSRATLYRDTWNTAREKPWFGWGMGSYPTVFFYRNTQRDQSVDGLPRHFHDAHSDWLQSAVEVGLVGTALLGLCALVPLYQRRRTLFLSPISTYLLAGCGLIVLYAWLEFPFGNRAVIAAFWACFFTAVHYGRAEGGTAS